MLIRSSDSTNYICCQMNTTCSGNQCMAWREEYLMKADGRAFKDKTLYTKQKTGLGYCGLAGKYVTEKQG